MEIKTKEEYDKYMGFNKVDIGSRHTLLKEVVKLAKKRGYKTGRFYSMPLTQLRAVHRKLAF